MPITEIHICQCERCQQTGEHPDRKLHQEINLLLSRLDEQQRRWYVAIEANRVGHGGIRLLSEITGMDEKTIQRGQKEIEQGFAGRPEEQARVSGGGRQRVEKKTQRS
jgi:hypothetical protein